MNLENLNVVELNAREVQETEGGIIGLIAIAFWGGVAYGYVKEKYESGQW